MLDWLFIMLLVIAILLILLCIEFEFGPFWDMILPTICITLLFILGASVMDIESPYSIYNGTSGQIETGYHTVQSDVSPYISYLFSMIGIIMVIYFIGYVLFPALHKKWMR